MKAIVAPIAVIIVVVANARVGATQSDSGSGSQSLPVSGTALTNLNRQGSWDLSGEVTHGA